MATQEYDMYQSLRPKADASNSLISSAKRHRRLKTCMVNSNFNELDHCSSNSSTSHEESENDKKSILMQLIKVYLVIGKPGIVMNVSALVNNMTKMPIVIEKVIKEFNSKLKEGNASFSLDENPDKYCLKMVKKNGNPRRDLPSFDDDSTLNDTGVSKFALVWREDPANYKDYFIKSSQKLGAQEKCLGGCTII